MTKVSSLFVGLCFGVVSAQLHAGCHSHPPYEQYLGKPNEFPILDGHKSMVLVKEVHNGRLYSVTVNADGSGDAPPATFTVAHVWGSASDWGRAQAELYGDQLRDSLLGMWDYMVGQAEGALSEFPKWLRDLIAELGLEAALEATYLATTEFTDPRIYEELRALAAAANVPFSTVKFVHMLPGLTQGKCSMFGAWGPATADGHLLQMRALDWDMKAPIRNHSAVTVYHPTEREQGHAHVTVGVVGFAGALSGVSAAALAISEIGVSYPDASFGTESRIGVPFIFVLRSILAYDTSKEAAVARLRGTRRTCDLILGVGDGKMATDGFESFAYSSSDLVPVTDTTLRPVNATWHPPMKGVVYHGMDWVCPSFNWMLHRQLKASYGVLTAEMAVQNVSAVQRSGDNHVVVYDFERHTMYVSFSATLGTFAPSAQVKAYQRQFVRFDYAQLFAEHPPGL
eukprot:TRINITY_DN2763_c0_g1_i1.p1 TRINITY_DN2763_c0_g1~~TRINITY_DN2763_c0_g1_i1.p1  ORF type:complete len:455 (-),score=94.49 TRINITY_DN2763_c0_g1_i1:206-1570(-)